MVLFLDQFRPRFNLILVISCFFGFPYFDKPLTFVEARSAVFGEDSTLHRPMTGNDVLYEGDIVLTKAQKAELTNHRIRRDVTNQRVRRKISTNLSQRWKLPIHYAFDGSHGGSERDLINSAINHWETKTCIRFVEITFNSRLSESLIFTRGTGCWSGVGFDSEEVNHRISIGPGCLSIGTIAHELGHVIGFWHEQARPDRDDYVAVIKDNVISGKGLNFEKYDWGEVMSYGVPYDVGSLMHYGSKFFSANGKRTIVTNDPRVQRVVGQRNGLSFADAKMANLAYCWGACENRNETVTCAHDGYPDPKNCSVCRCPDGLGGSTCQTVAPSTGECGGVLQAGHKEAFLESPGYPRAYAANLRCHWLIQAPPGYRIYVEFVDQFSVKEDQEADACADYLEVRYYDSLSLTGGRFCGRQKPQDTMISQSSQLLLLFRSEQAGQVGFRVKYHTEACGGCLASSAKQEKACVRTVTYPCLRKWQIRALAPCIMWWGWVITDCGYTYKTKTREDTCSRTERYCCENFRLEKGTCKSTSPDDYKAIPDYTGDGVVSIGESVPVVPLSWNSWSPWSECTKACGGCGLRTRNRQCENPIYCQGLEHQSQSEVCNEQVCPDTVVEFCVEKYPVKRICNPWILTTCTEYNTRMTTCHKECCQGYVRVKDRCVKQ